MQKTKIFIKTLLAALGMVWLFLEAYYVLYNTDPGNRIDFWSFLIIGIMLGIAWFLVDGFFLSGYLKRSIEISSNAFDTKIKVIFADLFSQKGWKAISVNDFFDSMVDGDHISENSLHGIMLKNYWGGNIIDWEKQVTGDLSDISTKEELKNRPAPGKQIRYPIGTTAKVSNNGNNFLCVVATHTNIDSLQVSASSDDLNKALRGLLCKARTVCSGNALNIPLIGSGLARTGIKPNIIVDLILLSIFDESKREKITNEIRIILPKQKRNEINISTIQKEWS